MNDSWLVLVNPISGQGRGRYLAGSLADIFARKGRRTEVVSLTGPGAAAEIISRRGADHRVIIAVGGDGTVTQVASAVLAAGQGQTLGLVPLGLSNCLARHLGLPLDPEEAVSVLALGRTRPVDVMFPGGRVALSFVGVGLDAAVVARVAAVRQGPIRDRDYIKAATETLWDRPWPRLAVEVDGVALPGFFYQVLVSPIENYAHYFHLPDPDGCRVYLFRGRGPAALLRTFRRSGWDRDLGRAADMVKPVRTMARITTDSRQAHWQYDGEAGGSLPLDLGVRRAALNFLA